MTSAAAAGMASRPRPSDYPWAVGLGLLLVAVPVALTAVLGSIGPIWLPAASAAAIAVGAYLARPFRSLVVIALYLLFIDTIAFAAGDRIKLVDELTIPLIGLITIVRERGRIAAAWWWPREAGVLLLLFAALGSTLLSGVTPLVWLPGLVLLGKGIGMFYITRLLPITDEDIRWAMGLVLAVGLVALALGFVELVAPQAFTEMGLRPSEERAGLPAIKSLFYHQQLFGWFCGFIALFLYAHHVVLKRRWMLVFALVFSVGTILSARRRAILAIAAGLAAGLGVDLFAGRREAIARVRRWIPSTVGLVVLSVAFLPAFAGLYQLTLDRYDPGLIVTGQPGVVMLPGGQVEDPGEVSVAPARFALYQTSVVIARDHFPLGAGLGRFGSWMSRQEYSDVYARYGLDQVFGLSKANPQFITDTFWPQILGETGVLGLIGYVAFLAALGYQLVQTYLRSQASPAATAVVLAAIMVLVQTLVESLASPVFNSPPQVYLIMGTIGSVLAWRAVTAQHDEVRSVVPPDDGLAPATTA